MRLLEKSGTLQILDSLKESNVMEDVSDLVNDEEEVLLGSEEFDGTDPEGIDVSGRKPIAGFYAGRGNSDPGIEIYEIDYGSSNVLARDLAKLDEKEQAHWYAIEYEFDDEDGNPLTEPRAYADVDGIRVYLDECIRTNLQEAEQTIDIFVNPERDYKITDVTMLEPVDDGDVRAIDMQSILIGLDESLTEKYGENWGEFNIQSSRTPRGKIEEDDISYVLHVLDINGHQEILNYNTKGVGRIREAFVTNYKGKVLESKRCAVSRIPKFFMEATEEFIKKYSESEEALTEDAVLPNNGYIDQTGKELVSDERIQACLRRRVQRLKARQKLLKTKQTFGKDGNVVPVDEKNTHGKEVADSDIGQETEPITDTKIEESVVTLDTDNGTVDIDGNVSHVALDPDGHITAESEGEVISATPVSVEINKSEEAIIADDSVLEPNEDEVEAEDINVSEEGEEAPEVPENTPEEALEEPSEDEVVETEEIAMAEPVPTSELEESAEDEVEDTELWCRGKIYWKGNHDHLDTNLLLDVVDQATEEEGEEIDVDEVEIKKIEESLKESPIDMNRLRAAKERANNEILDEDNEKRAKFDANIAMVYDKLGSDFDNYLEATKYLYDEKIVKDDIPTSSYDNKDPLIYANGWNHNFGVINYSEYAFNAYGVEGGGACGNVGIAFTKEGVVLTDDKFKDINRNITEVSGEILDYYLYLSEGAANPEYNNVDKFIERLERIVNTYVEAHPEAADDLQESLKESAEDIDKFWASDIKVGDKVMSSGAGEVEVLDLDRGKDYILIKRNTDTQPFVAAWAPSLDDEGKLFWGQGHYFDTEEAARDYFNNKLNEAVGVEEKVESEVEDGGIETKEEVIEEELVPSAIFHRKPSSIEDMKKEEENKVVTAKSTYVVKDVKEVDEAEFDDLCSDLLKNRDYIKEFADKVEVDNSVSFNCLEVRSPKGSLLIDPSGYGYARYCAFGNEIVEEPVEEVKAEEEIVEEPVEGE